MLPNAEIVLLPWCLVPGPSRRVVWVPVPSIGGRDAHAAAILFTLCACSAAYGLRYAQTVAGRFSLALTSRPDRLADEWREPEPRYSPLKTIIATTCAAQRSGARGAGSVTARSTPVLRAPITTRARQPGANDSRAVDRHCDIRGHTQRLWILKYLDLLRLEHRASRCRTRSHRSPTASSWHSPRQRRCVEYQADAA